jgi:hypothetical protein
MGGALIAWAEGLHKELGISVKAIRQVVAEESSALMYTFQRESKSDAQHLAQLLQVTTVQALAAIGDGLQASKRKVILGKSGRPERNKETGEVEILETPDHTTRMAAAHMMLKVMGDYAPEQINVKTEATFRNLTDEQLHVQLTELISTASRIVGPTARSLPSPSDSGGDESAPRREGMLLLADGSDQDAGRAGSQGPVQAIPEPAVLPADPDGSGQ